MTRTLTIPYGDELFLGLASGQAAKLCGKERVAFLLDLPRVRVAVSNLQEEDADDEIAFARHGPPLW